MKICCDTCEKNPFHKGESRMKENKEESSKKEEEIEVQEELDVEAFDVIKRLYDGTFKDLANR